MDGRGEPHVSWGTAETLQYTYRVGGQSSAWNAPAPFVGGASWASTYRNLTVDQRCGRVAIVTARSPAALVGLATPPETLPELGSTAREGTIGTAWTTATALTPNTLTEVGGLSLNDDGGDGLPLEVEQIYLHVSEDWPTDQSYALDTVLAEAWLQWDSQTIEGRVYDNRLIFGGVGVPLFDVADGDSTDLTFSIELLPDAPTDSALSLRFSAMHDARTSPGGSEMTCGSDTEVIGPISLGP